MCLDCGEPITDNPKRHLCKGCLIKHWGFEMDEEEDLP